MNRISVFLSDWQVLFREGIHFTLSGEEDIEVIGEATSSAEALKAIQTNPPDVAVLNTNHDKLEGIRVAGYLRQNFPAVAVLLIMDNDDDEQLFMALRSGASACLAKDADPADLIEAIRAVAGGERPITDALLRPVIASRILDEFEEFGIIDEQVDNLLAKLTPGETELLHQIANGTPVDRVCQALNISEAEASRSFGFIVSKLVTNDYVRQVLAAAQAGLLPAGIRNRLAGAGATEFVTKDEFTAFKESLRERFRSLTGDAA